MNRVDVNHDGSLELAEFVAGLVDWNQLQADKQWGYWVQVGPLWQRGSGGGRRGGPHALACAGEGGALFGLDASARVLVAMPCLADGWVRGCLLCM